MYAIALDRNRQVKLTPGESVLLDYNSKWEKGLEVVLDQVCLVGGDSPAIGTPYVDGASVVVEVQGPEAGNKIVVRKFKRRKNYRRKIGYRPKFTRVMVKEIRS